MTRKVLIKVICTVLVLASALLLFGCAKDGSVPDGYMLASGDANDFDLFVPKSWTVSLSEGTVAAYCSNTDPSSVSVMGGGVEHADTTVDDFWEIYKSEFETVYTDFTLVETKDAALGGENGKCYVFTGKIGENTYRFEMTVVIHGGYVYMFTFTSTEELYKNHTTEVTKMLGYFRFR